MLGGLFKSEIEEDADIKSDAEKDSEPGKKFIDEQAALYR